LEEVDRIFLDSKNIFQAVGTARKMPRREALHGVISGEKVMADDVEIDGDGA
jgi:hypothetical protein